MSEYEKFGWATVRMAAKQAIRAYSDKNIRWHYKEYWQKYKFVFVLPWERDLLAKEIRKQRAENRRGV